MPFKSKEHKDPQLLVNSFVKGSAKGTEGYGTNLAAWFKKETSAIKAGLKYVNEQGGEGLIEVNFDKGNLVVRVVDGDRGNVFPPYTKHAQIKKDD
jgi:hypothetical protein